MKPTALFVKCRAPNWCSRARCRRAAQRRPGYAAVDVYEEEPIIGGEHPFLKMPNALCTPHLGWAEWDNFELYFRECFEQISKFEKGEPMRLANPTVKAEGEGVANHFARPWGAQREQRSDALQTPGPQLVLDHSKLALIPHLAR